MKEVRFDDRETLQGLVREEFGPFGVEIEITQAMVDRFAELTGDDQWIHTDPERCRRESPFGAPIAHGFLILSLIGTLGRPAEGAQDEGIPEIVGHRSVINYGADKLRFVSPVPVGRRVHARRRIAHVRKKGPGTQLTFESEIHVVGADKPAVIYRSLVLFMP